NFTNNGTLQGTGTFSTNSLINAGHVAPGNSPGLLTLTGAFEQDFAGFLDIELASNSLFDSFFIQGAAKLDGTLSLICALGCDLHSGDLFLILDSTGDLTGSFANVTTSGFGLGFQYDVLYDYGND